MTSFRSPVWARHGMVAGAQPLAVGVGVDILKRGGTAVDAAIAVNACLALMEPTSCGPGGDLFALVWDPDTRKLEGFNGSGRAPLELSAAGVPALPDGTIPLHSPWAWTVPGCVDGWFELHSRYGRLPMEAVLAPAVEYAREGFPVSPVIAHDWERAAGLFREKPGFAAVFLPGGRAPREGETFRNAALAGTLEAVAREGRDFFYRGPVARQIVEFSEHSGGCFSLGDFESHRSTWDEPIATEYRGHVVWQLPPPGQGLATLQILNLLETFDLEALGRQSADYWHLMIEAKKVAYADRARYYADPAFSEVPVAQLLSKTYAREQARRIDPLTAAEVMEPGDPLALGRRETTYLATADQNGLMTSWIQSNYTGFGSGYVIPELGFGLQNRGALFALAPAHPNRLEPGKRPFHTIIPAFMTKAEEPLMAFGVMGGDMQPQGQVQVLVNLIDLGMNVQEAGDAIRFHHTGSSEPTGTVMRSGGVLHLEDGLPVAIVRELVKRGHVIEPARTASFGGYQAIRRDPDTGAWCGATEKRKDGCAQGY